MTRYFTCIVYGQWLINSVIIVLPHILPSGYQGALLATSRATFGRVGNAVPIYLDQVTCYGIEPALSECHHRNIGSHDCSHYEDAGVICQQRKSWGCGSCDLKWVCHVRLVTTYSYILLKCCYFHAFIHQFVFVGLFVH